MWREPRMAEVVRTTGESLLASLCPVPDALESEEQRNEFYHVDLEEMTTVELRRARARVVMRLAGECQPHPWHLDRLQAPDRRLTRAR
jgi:hypothetical protein